MKSYQEVSRIIMTRLASLLIVLVLGGCTGNRLAEPVTQAQGSPVTPTQTPLPATPTLATAASVSTPSATPIPATPIPPTPTRTATSSPGLLASSPSQATPLPPTNTATARAAPPTPTLTPTPVPVTAAPTSTPPLPTATATLRVTATPLLPAATPTLTGQFTLLKPLPADPCYGDQDIHFEWQWSGPFDPARQGFELRIWREDEPPVGAHDAVLDNKNGQVKALGQNIYSLDIRIGGALGVRGRSGDYLWTILLVEIAPEYHELGIQAAPGRLCFVAPDNGSSDKNQESSGGGGDSRPINP